MNDWRPIKSAPKDGTHCLLLKTGMLPTVGYFDLEFRQWCGRCDDDFRDDDDRNEFFAEGEYEPDWWMPLDVLPEPPES